MTLTYISEIPVGGQNKEHSVAIGGDDSGWAVTLDDKAFIGRSVEGQREAVLCQHSHQCCRHTVLPGVIQLRGLW